MRIASLRPIVFAAFSERQFVLCNLLVLRLAVAALGLDLVDPLAA